MNFCNKQFTRNILIKVIVYFTLTIVSYSSLYMVKTPLLLIVTYIFYGIISLLFAFNFAHDFSHNTIFKDKGLNHICFIVLYTMVGAHAEAWKDRHVKSHHHAPNVEGYDTDLEITNLIRVVPGSEIKWFHRFQYIYAPFLYTTYSLFWVFIKDFKVFFGGVDKNKKCSLNYKISFWSQKTMYVGYLVVLPLALVDLNWYWIIVAFIAMAFGTITFFTVYVFYDTPYKRFSISGNR